MDELVKTGTKIFTATELARWALLGDTVAFAPGPIAPLLERVRQALAMYGNQQAKLSE